MPKVIRGGAPKIIYKVFMRCLAEFQAGKLLSNLDDVYYRIADFTGVSLTTVRRIVEQGIESSGKFFTPAKHRQGRPLMAICKMKGCVSKCRCKQYTYANNNIKKLTEETFSSITVEERKNCCGHAKKQ